MLIGRFGLFLALAGLFPVAAARAHYVADEATFGTTSPTAENPGAYYVSDKLSGAWYPKESLQLKLDALWTYDLPSPPPSGAHFATSAANIYNFSLMVSWDV